MICNLYCVYRDYSCASYVTDGYVLYLISCLSADYVCYMRNDYFYVSSSSRDLSVQG